MTQEEHNQYIEKLERKNKIIVKIIAVMVIFLIVYGIFIEFILL